MAREGSLGRRTHDEPAVFEQFGIRSDVAGAMPRFAGGLVEWRLEEYQTRYGVPKHPSTEGTAGVRLARGGQDRISEYVLWGPGQKVNVTLSLCHFLQKVCDTQCWGEKDVRSRSQVQSSPTNDPNPSPGCTVGCVRLASCVVRACVHSLTGPRD